MKQEIPVRSRAIALLLAAVALPIAPAFAQDAQPAPAAPTVVLPAPATAPETASQPPAEVAPSPALVMGPSVPVVQPLPERPAPVAAADESAAPVAHAERPRVAPLARSTAPAARAIAPAATVAPVEVNPAPVAEIAPTPAPVAAPVETAPAAADTVQASTQTRATGPWLWIAGGVVIALALLGFLFSRRRRVSEDACADDLAYEAAPVAAQPLVEAERPWIELGMRPVRAGTEGNDAVVEFELTVDNSGSVPAKDVRISTWMFSEAPGVSEAERTLIAPPAEASLTTLDIPAGDGEQVDAKLALATADMAQQAGETFTPVVVADARYPLPDGGEGRISASFAIGVSEDGEIAPFPAGVDEMREDVEARLHGELERA